MDHVRDRLAEYILGVVADDERESIAAHLAGCRSCGREALVMRETMASVAPPATAAPQPLRARLLSSLAEGGNLAFASRLAALFDLSPAAARELIERADRGEGWEAGPVEKVRIINVTPGPRLGGAMAFLALFDPGLRFPSHTHHGEEELLILRGSFTDAGEGTLRPGDQRYYPAGSSHTFVVPDDRDCLCAVKLHEGYHFD